MIDSTALIARLGDAGAARFWADHDQRARRSIAKYGGTEIDRSDGFFLLFDHPASALRFASDYHRVTSDLGAAVRVGIHHAIVTLRHNPPDDVARGAKPLEVEGLAKPLTARIMALAGGGRTLLSAEAAAVLDPTALDGQVIRSHGHYRLKGIVDPVEVVEAAAPGRVGTPPGDGEKAYRVVAVGGLWRPVREVRHNLAPERDDFVGRQVELRALAELLEGGARLVTVLGAAGTGKTRLARRYAAAWLGEWPGGAYFCDLSEARSLEGIHFVVALALGVPLGKGDAGMQLGHAISARGRCLVILDNFEQVELHAPNAVGRWLDLATEACFVVTSRVRLRLPGESIAALDTLPLADEAITLFELRARTQRPDFAVDERNRDAVAQIVRLLDGLPLAIELAAARVSVLSVEQIVERMKDRFTLLAGARGVAARQATLKAAIDWSWDLLAPSERAALAQCVVFDGGFTLKAAEAVIVLDTQANAPSVLDAIHSLVDKSLLRALQPASSDRLDIGEPFFAMYLSIREYAAAKLRSLGDEAGDNAELRHARYFAGFGSDDQLDALLRHGGVARRQRLALDLDNLVGGCRRAVRRRQDELAAGCFLAAWAVLEVQGPFNLASILGRQVAALDTLPPRVGARVQAALASALRDEGKTEASDAELARSLALAQEAGDTRGEALAWRLLAVARHRDGRTEEALRCFETALALHETVGDQAQLGAVRANLANLQMELGSMAQARASYEAAIALQRAVGNRAGEAVSIGNLGTLLHELGELAPARSAYEQALVIHRNAGSVLQEAITLGNLGILESQHGDHRAAAECYRAALAIYRETGSRRGEGVALSQIGDLHRALGEPEAAFAAYEDSLRICREVGNRRFEGGVLAGMGELQVDRGLRDEGLRALEEGEDLLREVGDPLDLAKVVCAKGRVAFAGGDIATARAALTDAGTIGDRLGAAPGSDLGRQIDGLRSLLDGA
ncbi:MAG: tetratricopeptide repeat protein [Burkholderiaceae bacterium]